MERLWSRAAASGGNRWQMLKPRKRLEGAKTVAVGCDQLPEGANGKEGVQCPSRLATLCPRAFRAGVITHVALANGLANERQHPCK
jgi:hypothetical protein